ncbi:MAG: SIS domain-containing protein [Gammaproteobacteria bacterium]|nr:SIS domain-containing protein [Gammaproteobacteria bacterium]
MSRLAHIDELFEASIAAKQAAQRVLTGPIDKAAQLLVQALASGGKIMACGNGGSAADSQHFAAELLNRFELERAPLPAIALTTDSSTITSIGNDFGYDDVFVRQLLGLGKPGDVLLAISTSGGSANICRAIDTAHELGLRCILLSGRDGGAAAGRLSSDDIELRVPASNTARIQEVHILILHILCGIIDQWCTQGDNQR